MDLSDYQAEINKAIEQDILGIVAPEVWSKDIDMSSKVFLGQSVSPSYVKPQETDFTVEVYLDGGDVVEVETVHTYSNEAVYFQDQQTISIADKHGSMHYFNRNEVIRIKVISLQGKMAEVEEAVK